MKWILDSQLFWSWNDFFFYFLEFNIFFCENDEMYEQRTPNAQISSALRLLFCVQFNIMFTFDPFELVCESPEQFAQMYVCMLLYANAVGEQKNKIKMCSKNINYCVYIHVAYVISILLFLTFFSSFLIRANIQTVGHH